MIELGSGSIPGRCEFFSDGEPVAHAVMAVPEEALRNGSGEVLAGGGVVEVFPGRAWARPVGGGRFEVVVIDDEPWSIELESARDVVDPVALLRAVTVPTAPDVPVWGTAAMQLGVVDTDHPRWAQACDMQALILRLHCALADEGVDQQPRVWIERRAAEPGAFDLHALFAGGCSEVSVFDGLVAVAGAWSVAPTLRLCEGCAHPYARSSLGTAFARLGLDLVEVLGADTARRRAEGEARGWNG